VFAGHVHVHDRRGTVRLLEIRVGETDALEIPAGDGFETDAVELDGQLRLQVDGVALDDDRSGRGGKHHGVGLAREGGGAGGVDVVVGVHGLLDVQEPLVVARRLSLDTRQVLLERGREGVVTGRPRDRRADALAAGAVRGGGVAADEEVSDPAVVTADDERVPGDVSAVRAVVWSTLTLL